MVSPSLTAKSQMEDSPKSQISQEENKTKQNKRGYLLNSPEFSSGLKSVFDEGGEMHADHGFGDHFSWRNEGRGESILLALSRRGS